MKLLLYSGGITKGFANGLKMISFFLLTLCLCTNLLSQENTGRWETYMASYEGGKPGSTTVRMDLIDRAPLFNYNYVLVTGIAYESEREDGLPKGDKTFKLLHKIGDELDALLKEETEGILVGSFTYNFERLEYFYLKSAEGIKERIEAFYKENYPDKTYRLNIKEDKTWEYYTQFLYPNEDTQNHMYNLRVVNELKKAGDNLTKTRRIDHWMYFKSKEDLERFEDEIVNQNFKVEFTGRKGVVKFPYSIQFYSYGKVDIDTINPITAKLHEMAKNYNAMYDGWETVVVTD